MQESGLIEIIPLICILTTRGQYPPFFHPESLRVPSWGWLQWLWGVTAPTSFVYWCGRRPSSSTAASFALPLPIWKKPFPMQWRDFSGPQNRPCELHSESQKCGIPCKEKRLISILHLNSPVRYARILFSTQWYRMIHFLVEIILRVFFFSSM